MPIVVGAVGLYLAWRYVPESRAQGGFGRFEALTAAAWAMVFLAAMFGLVMARLSGTWFNPITVTAGVFSALGLLLLIVWPQFTRRQNLGSGLSGVLLATVLALSGTADFKLRMADLTLTPQQQAVALQAVDTALRQGITADDIAQAPGAIVGLGLMAAYREAFSVGVASALVLAGAVAWFWLRGVKRAEEAALKT